MGQYPYCGSRPTAKQRAEQYIAHQHKTLSVVEHTMQNVLQRDTYTICQASCDYIDQMQGCSRTVHSTAPWLQGVDAIVQQSRINCTTDS